MLAARKAEELGREIAALHRDESPEDANRILRSWVHWLEEGSIEIDEAASEIPFLNEEEIKNFTSLVIDGAWAVVNDTHFCSEKAREAGVRRKLADCPTSEFTEDFVRYLDKAYHEMTGKKRCSWLRGVKEPYNVTSAVNDITACFHRILEIVEKFSESAAERRGKCVFASDANDAVREACIAWDNATKLMDTHYANQDRRKLYGKGMDDWLELRVGSSAGHLVHLDFGKGRLEYLDHDDDVNRVVYYLLTRYGGLRCRIEEQEGVFCEGLNGENAARVGTLLAAVTSMDIRLGVNRKHLWSEDEIADCEKRWREISKSAEPDTRLDKREATEVCLVTKYGLQLESE